MKKQHLVQDDENDPFEAFVCCHCHTLLVLHFHSTDRYYVADDLKSAEDYANGKASPSFCAELGIDLKFSESCPKVSTMGQSMTGETHRFIGLLDGATQRSIAALRGAMAAEEAEMTERHAAEMAGRKERLADQCARLAAHYQRYLARDQSFVCSTQHGVTDDRPPRLEVIGETGVLPPPGALTPPGLDGSTLLSDDSDTQPDTDTEPRGEGPGLAFTISHGSQLMFDIDGLDIKGMNQPGSPIPVRHAPPRRPRRGGASPVPINAASDDGRGYVMSQADIARELAEDSDE